MSGDVDVGQGEWMYQALDLAKADRAMVWTVEGRAIQ